MDKKYNFSKNLTTKCFNIETKYNEVKKYIKNREKIYIIKKRNADNNKEKTKSPDEDQDTGQKT